MDFPDVHLTREFDAPVAAVFQAWVDPAQVSRWMAPGVTAEAVIDARPGGRYVVTHSEHGRRIGGFDAVLRTIEPPTHLVWDWGLVVPGRFDNPIPSRLEVTLEPLGDHRTRLTLCHTGLSGLGEHAPHIADRVEEGWAMVLDQLPTASSAA